MNLKTLNSSENGQLRLFIFFAVILFAFRIVIGHADTLILRIVQDIILILVVLSLLLTLINYQNNKSAAPLSLVMNVGILNAIAFFLITFADIIMSAAFDNVNLKLKNPGLVYNFVSVFYVIIFIVFFAYVILALRHLFFLSKGKNTSIYFNTMIVFFILASLSANFFSSDELSFLSSTFLIVSVLLMIFNSIKISWIAFLLKKEKIYLLILSVIISVLFVVNLSSGSDPNIHNQVLKSFSPSLDQFAILTMIYGAIYFFILFFTTLFHLPTAEAYDRKAQEVSSLQYFSKLITQVLDFNDLAETVTDITTKVSNSNSAWIMWKEKDNYSTIAYKNIGYVDSQKISDIIISKVNPDNLNFTKALNLGETLVAEKGNLKFNIVSVSPLRTKGEVKGILIAAKAGDNIFTEDDLKAITTFSDYASIAIENSRLLKESIEKERLEKELDVAREIQRKILPESNPVYDDLEISSVFIPAFEVGGDYYDFFKISDKELGFVIADVSGKGISAAFIMAEVKGIFESLSKTANKPKDILVKANEILRSALDTKTFVSAAYGFLNLDEGILYLARAGHCPILLIRNSKAEQMKPSGIGLGLSEARYFESTLDEIKIDLKENDTIVLYTDGITDARNEAMQDFGESYFTDILLKNCSLNPDELSKKVIQEVTLFSSNHSQYDDITLVILKWKSQQNRDRQKIKIDGEKEWQNSTLQS